MTLADILDRHAGFTPDKVALRFEGEAWTYAGLADRIARTARRLRQAFGIGHGDRVAVLSSNHPETLILLHACARLGAMLVPLNWRLAVPELAFILGHAEPRLLVVHPDFAGAAEAACRDVPAIARIWIGDLGSLAEGAEPLPAGPGQLSDPVLLVYTSGTTGRPKGALLTQESLVWNGAMSRHMHGLAAEDHVLTVLPLFHVGGMNIQTVPALHHGATVTLHPGFEPAAVLAALAQERPTLTVLVPTTIRALLDAPGFAEADLSCLRAITTGSTYVPAELIAAVEHRGVPVLQVYGATETCPIAVHTSLGGRRSRPDTAGWPGLHCEAGVFDDEGQEVPHGRPGEIRARGPQLFSGYWRDPAASEAALRHGWFLTGDVATREPDGSFTIHDRKSNVIVSGGENIYGAEIERVLLAHPSVQEAAVVGRPDPRWGESPVAYLVFEPGAPRDTAPIAEHVRRELARFKQPRAYVVVDDLPKTALGKVQHATIRQAWPTSD